MTKQMENRVAIVTGAASGMGKAIVERFLLEGAKVVGFSLEETCPIHQDNFTYIQGNVGDFEACEFAVKKTLEEHGKVDCLVNSAGITREGTLQTTTPEVFEQVMKVNLFGTFNMCKAAIEVLKKQPSTIVNISSNMGAKPLQERVAYNPSKAAVNMLTECIALDHGPMVRANTVMPGIVKTPMIEKRLLESEDPQALLDLYASFYPMNRIGSVEDIVNSVLFLSTEASSWMTGAHLPACGGDQL